MSLLTLIVVLVVVGLLMWLINAFIPMEPRIKQLLNVVVIVFLVVWFLLQIVPGLPDLRIGR